MYHDMLDELDDQLIAIPLETVASVAMKDGWIGLNMKDGSFIQLIQSMESLFQDEFNNIAGMIIHVLQRQAAKEVKLDAS